jgi:hypothetical protein
MVTKEEVASKPREAEAEGKVLALTILKIQRSLFTELHKHKEVEVVGEVLTLIKLAIAISPMESVLVTPSILRRPNRGLEVGVREISSLETTKLNGSKMTFMKMINTRIETTTDPEKEHILSMNAMMNTTRRNTTAKNTLMIDKEER